MAGDAVPITWDMYGRDKQANKVRGERWKGGRERERVGVGEESNGERIFAK